MKAAFVIACVVMLAMGLSAVDAAAAPKVRSWHEHPPQ